MAAEKMSLHNMVYLTLFLAVVAVVLAGFGMKAYYDVAHGESDSQTVHDLTVKNNATVDKDLTVKDDLVVQDTLAVTGASTLTGNVTAGGTLGVTGAVTASSTLAVTGASTLTGAVAMSSTLTGNRTNVELVTAADTLTAAESGKMFVFNDADGAILTLPDSGAGDIIGVYFDFYINVSATSNEHKVVCSDTTNEIIYGTLVNTDTDTTDTVAHWPAQNGDGFSAIACDGTATGGQGSYWRLTNIAADVWKAEGAILGSGTVATPFGIN